MEKPTKQLRVHNWSGIFLERLNEFYSKTDHCDVTLQFDGNAQLKVHRLVLNVCSNFFGPALINDNITDSNGEAIVIMPPDLQADVMLPIINFMYTGLLDYESAMFHKLYKAADLLHMPVLTKLLDSQRTSSVSVNLLNKNVLKRKTLTPPTNSTLLNTVKKFKPIVSSPSSSSILSSGGMNKRKKHMTTKLTKTDPTEQAKPFRFDWPDDYEPQVRPTDVDFGSIPKKAIITYNDYAKVYGTEDMCQNNNNSPPSNTLIDMDAMKDYVKEQKIRADLMNFEKEYEDDYNITKIETKVATKKDTNEEETTLTIKMKNIEAELDHTKIISEVLKKYPDIVKKNKNIRLKIMSDSAKQPQKTIKLTSQLQDHTVKVVKEAPKISVTPIRNKRIGNLLNETNLGPWKCTKCPSASEFVLYYLYRKHMIDEHNEHYDNNQCKYCGKKCKNLLMLEYHTHTEHNLQTSKTFTFPRCQRCAYIAPTTQILGKHVKLHRLDEVKCDVCELVFVNKAMYLKHLQITNHSGANNSAKSKQYEYDCQYCMKRYKAPMNLYSHMKQCHGNDSARDGVFLSFETETDGNSNGDEVALSQPSDGRVKILSDIKVEQKKIEQIETIDANELSTVANSLGLVDIVVFNEDDQQYILQPHQPSQIITTSSGATTTTSDITSTDELVMVLTDHDYNNEGDESIIETNQGESANNSNIVVLYSHPCDASGQQSFITTTQGNLMVNSETGLIEIHQNAGAGAEGIVATAQPQPTQSSSQEGQIESIEMIQREIESHIQQESESAQAQSEPQTEEKMEPMEETFSEAVAPAPVESESAVEEKQEGEFMELTEGTSFELNAEVAPVLEESQPTEVEPEQEPEQEQEPEPEPELEPEAEAVQEPEPPVEEKSEESKEENVPVAEEVPSEIQLTETMTTVINEGESVEEKAAETEEAKIEEAPPADVLEQESKTTEEVGEKSGTGEVLTGQSSITNIILDDWEDTDSQQSDKPNLLIMKEAAVETGGENAKEDVESNGITSKQTVNKIMDEWDVKDEWENEEEEGRKENVSNDL